MCTIAVVILNVLHPGYLFKEPKELIAADEKDGNGNRHYICGQCQRARRWEEFRMTALPSRFSHVGASRPQVKSDWDMI